MAHRLTVNEAQAASIGLLVRHTPSKYPILYDPVSGVNLKKMEADVSIDLGDTVDVRNLIRLQDQGCCTVLPLYKITDVVVTGGTADVVVTPMLAEENEPVSIAISNVVGGATLAVTYTVDGGAPVATTENTAGSLYSFLMPAGEVVITVAISA